MSNVINQTGTAVDSDTAGEYLHNHVDGGRADSYACVLLEQGVYGWGQQLSPDYTGGSWTVYRLDNGGFYAAPDAPHGAVYATLVNGNGYDGTLSAEAFGITATLFALNHLMWFIADSVDNGQALLMVPDAVAVGERLRRLYYLLRDEAANHPEAADIYAAID